MGIGDQGPGAGDWGSGTRDRTSDPRSPTPDPYFLLSFFTYASAMSFSYLTVLMNRLSTK